VNEWALCAALIEHDPVRWSGLGEALIAQALQASENADNPAADLRPAIEESAAFARFERLSSLESQPKLRALLDAAAARGLPHVVDESELTLGAGVGGANFSMTALPDAAEVRWEELRDIPTAMSRGQRETTTVRLLAAAHGHVAGTQDTTARTGYSRR